MVGVKQPMVSDPLPARKFRHRCHEHCVTMVENHENGGIHCPICQPRSYDNYVEAFREWTYGGDRAS